MGNYEVFFGLEKVKRRKVYNQRIIILYLEEIDKGRKTIRTWSWVLLILFFLGVMILILVNFLIGLEDIITNWFVYYAGEIVFLSSLIGLFMYKKWGFYLFTVHLIYTLVGSIIDLNYFSLIISAIISGYIIWYRAFYKNLSSFE